jgi:hypothetical protein
MAQRHLSLDSNAMASEKVRKVQDLRRSNSATAHDARPNRERSRGDSKRKAIKQNIKDIEKK